MKQTTINRNKQQGYTMVEILIGVIVAAIVVAGVYAGWNTFYTSNQASTSVNEITQIIQNTQALYAQSSDDKYTGLTLSSAIAAGVFPSSMKQTSGAVTNSYNGSVTLAADSSAGFDLTYKAVPQNVCSKIISSVNTTTLLKIYTSTSTSLWTTGSAAATGAAIAAACTPSSTGTSTTIDITFVGS